MAYDYEKCINGAREATLSPKDPASYRLKQALTALKFLPEGANILEVGCGAGQFIRAIKKYCPHINAFGLDISNTAIERAKALGEKIVYTCGNGITLPYQENYFDAVVFFDVIEHVDDPEKFLKEISRVLKNQCVLYCFVPCEGDTLSFWYWLDKIGLKNGITKEHAGHINYFSRKSVAGLFEKAGFKIYKANYSEHLIGQILGILAFYLVHFESKKNNQAVNNEAYFARYKSPLNKAVKFAINSWIYFESLLLSWLPSPNIHIFARKSQQSQKMIG